jgi:hypothetical protein
MGLLDDLKKQAEQVKTQQLSEQALRAESLKLVEQKMKQAFQYVHELLKQLAVLKPVNPTLFAMPGIADLKDLQYIESFIDYRKTSLHDTEVFDLITFYIRWGVPGKIVVERDMPAAAQKARDVLYGGGIKFTEEELKNERRVAVGWRLTADSSLVTDVRIKADHRQARLQMNSRNLLRLGPDDFVVPAQDVDEPWLEDFAMTLLGQQGNFRKYRTVVNPLAQGAGR